MHVAGILAHLEGMIGSLVLLSICGVGTIVCVVGMVYNLSSDAERASDNAKRFCFAGSGFFLAWFFGGYLIQKLGLP